MEIGYCSDASFTSKLSDKHKQHVQLATCLTAAGWRLSGSSAANTNHNATNNVGAGPNQVRASATVLLLGNTGTICKPLRDTLVHMGVQASAADAVMRKLHIHGVNTAHSIVMDRRRMEKMPYNAEVADPP